MIRINQLKLSIHHKPEDLKKKAAKLLRIRPEAIRSLHIVKQSVDARKKEDLLFIYTVAVSYTHLCDRRGTDRADEDSSTDRRRTIAR